VCKLPGFPYRNDASASVATCAIGFGFFISRRPQWVIPCLSVTLSNIISFLIYAAAFVSSMHIPRADRVISTENKISGNRIRAQIFTASRQLQNILRLCVRNITFRRPHVYISHIRSLPYICVISLSNCEICLQIKSNLDVSLTLDASWLESML